MAKIFKGNKKVKEEYERILVLRRDLVRWLIIMRLSVLAI
jgi:ribosomal protein S6